ncbi:o-succinylbenzoate--CoA ligase [Halobaculum sp. D14]|uniref:o-succinylbenzoate--CoA ligase n=1 Tax=Halobaculum sp. D14 TaxID=3421642 RepID=UPI003EB79F32
MRDWLSHRAATTPDAEALVTAWSGTRWTYADLDAAADEMAGRFAGLGVEAGDHVGVVMSNRPEYVTLVHAAMRLGVRLVPLGDRLTAAELAPKLDAADVTTVLCDADTERAAVEATASGIDADEARGDDAARDADPNGNAEADERDENGADESSVDESDGGGGQEEAGSGDAPRPSIPVVSVDEPQWEQVAHLRTTEPAAFESATWSLSDPLLMLSTSGTTGDPKLVVLRLQNVLASAVASAFRLGVQPGDRYLATLSLHHTGGIMPLYRAALYGTSVVLRREFDPGGAADDLREYDVTGVSLVPTMLQRMLDARGTLSDSLRVVLLGGAPAPDDLVERCRDYSVPVHPTYGMTETASQIATARPQEAFDRVGTVGRPLFWMDLSVVDDDGDPVPDGESGELVVSGPAVASSYYGDRGGDAFVGGALRTGDVGYRDDDGYVYVLNRRDDRIITGGENVDPGEVAAVIREHAGVRDAAVAGVPDEEWGERVAALVVRDDPDLSAADLESFCRDRLAGFKLPRTVRFTDELPRTVSGTVDRTALRDRLSDDDAEPAADADGDAEPSADTDSGTDSDPANDAGTDAEVDTDAGDDE